MQAGATAKVQRPLSGIDKAIPLDAQELCTAFRLNGVRPLALEGAVPDDASVAAHHVDTTAPCRTIAKHAGVDEEVFEAGEFEHVVVAGRRHIRERHMTHFDMMRGRLDTAGIINVHAVRRLAGHRQLLDAQIGAVGQVHGLTAAVQADTVS